jgi:hypothetical protein
MPAQENGTVGQDDTEQLRADIEQLRAQIEREGASRGFWGTIREAILRRRDAPMLEEIENLRSQLRQEREELRLENARLKAELERSQSQAALEAARQRGFLVDYSDHGNGIHGIRTRWSVLARGFVGGLLLY